MGNALPPRTQLFMVRLWLEDLGNGKTEWRGQVKHVMSGEEQYFREWTKLVEQLKEILSGLEKERTRKSSPTVA